jgi:hypothetical protein
MVKRIAQAIAIGFTFFALTNAAHGFGGFPHANEPAPPQPLFLSNAVLATGWASNTFMGPEEYARIKSTDILQRPNRHLHFYGNTVRYFHYKNAATTR